MFKVKSIRNVDWPGSIARASIDLEILPHGIILRDCLLKEGQFGWFLSAPSKKLKEPYQNQTTGKMMEYMDIAFFPKAIRDELNRVCTEMYDPAGVYTDMQNQADGHPLAEAAQAAFTGEAELPQ
jgi:DNA-binding cell septation regulator SpoVG